MSKPQDEIDVRAFVKQLLKCSEDLKLAAEGIRKAFARLTEVPVCGSCKAPIHQMHQQECFLSGRVGRWSCGLEEELDDDE